MSEPDNIVLQQLREIRAWQNEFSERVEQRFNQLEQTLSAILTRLTGVEQLVIMLVGLHKESDARLTRLEARVERLEKGLQP